MVKTIVSIAVTLALLSAVTITEALFVQGQFDRFGTAIESLQQKVEERTATEQDGRAVQALWDGEKKKLHVMLPHGDISYVDYWLSEAVGCIATKQYDEAQSKLTVLADICRQLPESYGITFGNIF